MKRRHRRDEIDELRALRAERAQLIREYGSRGQYHPSARMIGGLNPAAQRLHLLRQKIARIEQERRAPRAELEEISGTRGRYGLKYKIFYQGREGRLGTDNFGKWYVVANNEIIADNVDTLAKARATFERYVRE